MLESEQGLNKVVRSLGEATQHLISLNTSLQSQGRWDEAQRVLGWGRSLGEIAKEIGTMTAHPQAPTSLRQPHPGDGSLLFYVDRDNKLVMRASSRRNGGFYEHRILKAHYDLVCRKIASMAERGGTFRSQEILDRREMPTHEPLEVIRLFVKEGLLESVKKGTMAFVNHMEFAARATALWSRLPRR